jgi:hypothetical protein
MRRLVAGVAVVVMIMLILVTLGGCVPTAAPAAPAASDQAAAAGAAAEKPTVTLLLPEWAYTENIQQQIKTYNNDSKSLAMIDVIPVPGGAYDDKLKAMLAAGTLDAAMLINNGGIQTFQDFLVPWDFQKDLAGWDAGALDDFLPGGRKSVSVNNTLLGVPWRRYLCTTSYDHLVVFKQTKHEKEAKDAVTFLTAPKQQSDNLKADTSYPTRRSVNSDSPKCGDGSSSMATASFDPAVADQIKQSKELIGISDELQSTLQKAGVLPNGATILLDRLAYYIEGAEGTYITKPGEYKALVAAPIALPDGSSVPPPTEPPAQAVAMISSGKLVINDKGQATFTPDRDHTDALVLTSDVKTPQKVNDLKAHLLSLDGKPKDAKYSIEDVFGANPPKDPKNMGIVEFVSFAYGSPRVWCHYGKWPVPHCICVNL